MIELHADKSEKVYRELALTGKYFNTGKVLIGVSHAPRPRTMSRDEELIQSALLRGQGPRITPGMWGYACVLGVAIIGAIMAYVS